MLAQLDGMSNTPMSKVMMTGYTFFIVQKKEIHPEMRWISKSFRIQYYLSSQLPPNKAAAALEASQASSASAFFASGIVESVVVPRIVQEQV
jgi:hypothetical protein